jgi:uncharacterized protein YbjT (DUF2867 family)
MKDKYTIVICAATGNQGKEVINRFREINETNQYEKTFYLKALTRSASSKEAMEISSNVSVVETNYSTESMNAIFKGVDALYLNYAMVKNEAEVESSIIDAALNAGVKHIVYASTISCENDHGVPHWTSSYATEEHLKKCHSESANNFLFHFVRLGHFNENMLPGSYFPPKNGKLTYPWRSDARFPTSSLRDAARVACKLFAEPWKLANGSSIDTVTEYVTTEQIAAGISKAEGKFIKAAKGPWIFTTFGHYFGWEASTILTMAEYIDANELLDMNFDTMLNLLKEEIDVEPLETIEKFTKRHF